MQDADPQYETVDNIL